MLADELVTRMPDGLHICFDLAFDSGAWPGPLRATGREALFGSAWLGPMGLAARLELGLGIAPSQVSAAERIASLVPSLWRTEGYWSRSLEVDPFGTATRILGERDMLWEAGWRGEPVTPRFELLRAVTRDVPPGLVDRLERVVAALFHRDPGIARLELVEDAGALPAVWRRVVEALAANGAEIVMRGLADVPARADLAGARSTGFTPKGDGSLQLIRPNGPLAAAEEVAAWLGALPDLDETVIVGPDIVLERTLRAHGLPTTGAGEAREVLLSVLPLVLELAWRPADPKDAHQLLLLPRGPVPRGLAVRLVRALHDWPAVDSDAWRRALDAGLSAIDNEARRERVRQRIATIFSPAAQRGALLAREAIEPRLWCIERWARSRPPAQYAAASSPWAAIVAQCRTLRRVLELSGVEELTAPDLRRALELVGGPCEAVFGAEVGAASVSDPGSVAGPAKRIVWWSFDRASAPLPRPVSLSAEERGRLLDAGVTLPYPGTQAEILARSWRRPLTQAAETLLFVCPRRGISGEELYPHPLWDEIEAQVLPEAGPSACARLLCRSRPQDSGAIRRTEVALLPPPAAPRTVRVPAGRIGHRQEESPSGLSKLIGCPLAWTLDYFTPLYAGIADPPLELGSLLFGKLAHELFRCLLDAPPLPVADEVESVALALFDREGPRLAAPLFLPGAESERGDVRQRIAAAARVLLGHIERDRARVRSSEQTYSMETLGSTLSGRPDLVLETPATVIDLKWGGRAHHHEALREGTALQLAAYSALAAAAGLSSPSVAYFILRSQELLTGSTAFSRATYVSGPTPEDVWSAVLAAHAARRAELDGGIVVAAGNPDADGGEALGQDELEDGTLRLAPPCHFCAFDLLCGRAVGGER